MKGKIDTVAVQMPRMTPVFHGVAPWLGPGKRPVPKVAPFRLLMLGLYTVASKHTSFGDHFSYYHWRMKHTNGSKGVEVIIFDRR